MRTPGIEATEPNDPVSTTFGLLGRSLPTITWPLGASQVGGARTEWCLSDIKIQGCPMGVSLFSDIVLDEEKLKAPHPILMLC